MSEEMKRNAYSSERINQNHKKSTDDGCCDEETTSNSKLKDSLALKENSQQSSRFSKRTNGRQSPTTDDTLQGRQKSQTASHLNSISHYESNDSIHAKNNPITNEESRGKIEKRNSLPTSPTSQNILVGPIAFSKQKYKFETQENNEEKLSSNTLKDSSPTLEDIKYQSMTGRKNLMLQRAQLQRLDQYNKKEESNNFIKEEEEDDDDILFQESFAKKTAKLTNENELDFFEEDGNELSIIKLRGTELQTKTPLALQNIQKYQRNQISNSQASTRNRKNQTNDIASMLQELDLEDYRQKVVAPQTFAFSSLKRNTGYKKVLKNTESATNIKPLLLKQSNSNPLTENNSQPLRILSQGSIPTLYQVKQQQQQLQNIKTAKNFYPTTTHMLSTHSSNLKQRSSYDVNHIMNQNFLQDIKDLRKKLQKQSFVMKALNV